AHRLGPGERADDRRYRLGEHIPDGPARLLDHGEPDAVAVFEPVLRQAGLAQEAFERLRRGAGARALGFLADGLRGLGQLAPDQCEAPRGRPDGDLADRDPGFAELLAEQLLEVGAGAGLHACGDFLAAEFEEEVGHAVHPAYSAAQRSASLAM